MAGMEGLLLAGLNDAGQQGGNLAAQLLNLGQYARGETEIANLRNRILPQIEAISKWAPAAYGDITNAAAARYGSFASDLFSRYDATGSGIQSYFDNLSGNIDKGYQDRLDRNLKYLEGAGAQERKDIQRRFAEENASMTRSLNERGLGGTTVLPSLRGGLKRQESDSIGGLEERLRQQRLNTDATLSGDQLASRMALGQYGTNLRRDIGLGGISLRQGVGQYGLDQALGNDQNLFNIRAQYGMLPLQTDRELTGGMLDWYNNLSFSGPQPNYALQTAIGNMTAPKPEQPKTDWWSPVVGGLSYAGGAALGNPGLYSGGGGGGGGSTGLTSAFGLR